MKDKDVPCPENIASVLKANDTLSMAKQIFDVIGTLHPVMMPPLVRGEPAVAKAWQEGRHVSDEGISVLAVWFQNNVERSLVISENARRLRATLWAHSRLRFVGDYAAHFADFHRRFWGIEVVPDPYYERETLVQDRARSGAKPWGFK